MTVVQVIARSGHCLRIPAFAALALLARPAVAAEVGEMRYDPDSRIVYLGSAGPDDGGAATITVGRAVDLAGRPLRRVPVVVAGSSGGPIGPMPSGLPFSLRTLTSGFGMREHPILGGWREHTGIDLAARAGTPIAATSDGLVSAANWAGGYGLMVALDHGAGISTRYGHMSRLNVVAGERVHRGDIIGYVGSTGRSTGPHLHYELRVGGRPVNPLSGYRPG